MRTEDVHELIGLLSGILITVVVYMQVELWFSIVGIKPGDYQ